LWSGCNSGWKLCNRWHCCKIYWRTNGSRQNDDSQYCGLCHFQIHSCLGITLEEDAAVLPVDQTVGNDGGGGDDGGGDDGGGGDGDGN
jgi:hypothetical protein